jgi:7-cyano-7-deazaguanine synthase
MNARRRVVVLLSGGMDSTVAFYDALASYDVAACLSFDYGAKHNAREIPFARWHTERAGVTHVVAPLAFVADYFASDLLKSGGDVPKGHYEEETMKKTVVPFRNGIMLSIAAGFAESREAEGLIIAAHAGDHAIYPDCREAFMESMAEAIRVGTYAGIELIRPFISMTKGEIAERGDELGVDFSQTWSCYVGGEVHCGECGTCVERREAFQLARLPDPTVYASAAALPPRPGSAR